jgi:hypothetical protein
MLCSAANLACMPSTLTALAGSALIASNAGTTCSRQPREALF